MKSDDSLIASKLSDKYMENVTKVTSCINLTDVDKTEDTKPPKTINLVPYKLYPTHNLQET